ncbi:MAG: hypothetical protein JXA20_00605 [Spirochaetes bacterium]|nr:hypothetical protein [Spirochaetota bacterium]
MKIVCVILMTAVLCLACSKERPKNTVDFDQINVDDSNDYRFIFRDLIQEEKRLKEKYTPREFK